MSVSRQRRLQIDKRRMQVAELALKGCRQIEIAERLGVAQATVSSDLKQLRLQWQAAAAANTARSIARQLDKLDLIEREAWDAWERSKQPSHVTVVERSAENEPVKMRQTLKHQTGDARYLDQVQKCLAAARELLGLSAAGKPHDGPRSLETMDETQMSFAEGLQLILDHPSYHSAPPPPPGHKPANMVDVEAECEKYAAEQRAANKLVAEHRAAEQRAAEHRAADKRAAQRRRLEFDSPEE